jgi:hypothetical protein
MQLLSSDWLRRMVKKSAKTPEAQIVNLFVILQDWLDAPGMREQLLNTSHDVEAHHHLNSFLHSLVAEANFVEPDKLAFQLYFLLLGALNEEIRNPGCNSMAQAGDAAASLVAAAKPPIIAKSRMLSVASFASVAMIALITGFLLIPSGFRLGQPQQMERAASQSQSGTPAVSRPDTLVALYQMNDKLKAGQCSYPQALMLAADQRAVFMEGVVNIDQLDTASTNLDEVRQLYQKVTCYYAPAAMQI